ncbi:MAG: hypothetical protein R6V53_03355 [Candidatus Woesearchaeota archaeon]
MDKGNILTDNIVKIFFVLLGIAFTVYMVWKYTPILMQVGSGIFSFG